MPDPTPRPFPPRQVLGALVVLLLLAGGLVTLCVRPTTHAPVVYHVSQQDGLDSRTCDQARSASTPRASINQGLACMQGGDTLQIAAGLYPEWLITQLNAGNTMEQRYLDVQPHTALIPSGLSSSQPTIIRGATSGQTILSPTTKNPETGAIIGSIGSYARFIVFENLHLHKAGGRDERSQGSGTYFSDSQDLTLRGGSVYRGTVKASIGSRRLLIERVVSLYAGEGCDFNDGDPNTGGQPCPHSLYVCGEGHIIRSNVLYGAGHTGAQVSCEQGSSSADVYGNIIGGMPGPGISMKGTGTITANLITHAGTGIRASSSITVANNTIIGYYNNNTWVPDPWGILFNSGTVVVNNLIYGAKKASYIMSDQDFDATDTSKVHTNMCDQSGNAGCTHVHPASTVFSNPDARDYTLKPGSPAMQTGTSTPAKNDLRGTPYPSPPDIGAYSSASAPPPPQDTQPPQISLTNPPPNEQVFAQLPLKANASDNVGVLGVTFLVNGAVYGQEVTSAPYQVTFDTTSYPNGNHTFTARARDAAGLSTTAAPRTLVVSNPVPPEPPTPPSGTVVLKCAGKLEGTNLTFACTQP